MPSVKTTWNEKANREIEADRLADATEKVIRETAKPAEAPTEEADRPTLPGMTPPVEPADD